MNKLRILIRKLIFQLTQLDSSVNPLRILKFVTVMAASFAPFAVSSQQITHADTLLNHFTGKWVLKGMIAGKNIQHDITADWVLGRQYIEFKETSQEKRKDGQPSYESIVYLSYNNKMNRYDCLWLDNTAKTDFDAKAVAHAIPKTNTIALLFKTGNKSVFHTTFTFIPNENKWHWKMESEDHGKFEVFADARMIKE